MLAQAALRMNERRYQLLFDHSQAGIVLHRHTTEILYANAMAARLLGIPAEEMAGAAAHDARWQFLKEDGSALPVDEYPVMRVVRQRREVTNLVVGVRRGDTGGEAWMMCNAYPILDAHSDTLQVIVSFTDVTELKETERALRKSEERLRLVLRGANDAAWDFEMASHKYYHSPRWWQMLGYEAEELPTDAALWRRLIHAEDLPRASRVIRRAVAGGASGFEIEIRLRHKAGHYVHTLSRAFILRDDDGRPVRISGTNTDVTERRRAEHAIRQSESHLRAFVEASPFPAMVADDRGNLNYFNPACVRTFGYAVEDVPTLRAWRARAHPNARYRRWVASTWSGRLDRLVRTGGTFEPFELQIRCRDGSERTALASVVALNGDAAGRRLIVLVDVTEQRRLERGVIEAATREQHRLGMDLHDGLGQELTGLSLSLAALARRVRHADPAELERELAQLAAHAAQCIATTRSISQGLSPVEAGCAGLKRALLRLAERGCIGDLAIDTHLLGLDGGPLDQAIGDSVYRIVQEALTNAARHARATRVTIEARRVRSALIVTVRDNGCGLRDALPHRGLGLNTMRYRANAIGGHIDIESPPTGGTLVRCRFPIAPARI